MDLIPLKKKKRKWLYFPLSHIMYFKNGIVGQFLNYKEICTLVLGTHMEATLEENEHKIWLNTWIDENSLILVEHSNTILRIKSLIFS